MEADRKDFKRNSLIFSYLAIVVILTVISLGYYFQYREALHEEFDAKAGAIIGSGLGIGGDYISDFDTFALKQLEDKIAETPIVFFVNFLDADNNPILEKDAGKLSLERKQVQSNKSARFYTEKIVRDGEQVGLLEIAFDLKALHNKIFWANIIFLLGFIIPVGTITLLFISIFRNQREITEGKKRIETLLDNLDQGFMIFDQQGVIEAGSSKAAHTFFQQDPTGKTFASVLGLEKKGEDSVNEWLDITFEGMLDFDELSQFGPSSYEKFEDKFISFSYRPIYAEGSKKLEKIICIASDKTREKSLQAIANAEKAAVKFVTMILEDRESFLLFVHDAERILDATDAILARNPDESSLTDLLREMHTMKGATSSFGVLEVSELAHSFESELIEIQSDHSKSLQEFIPNLKQEIAHLREIFENFLKDNSKIIGTVDNLKIEAKTIPLEKIHQVSKLIEEEVGLKSKSYKAFLAEFMLEDISTGFTQYERLVGELGDQLGKKVSFEIKPSGIQVAKQRYAPLFASLVHIFRNSMDHGIEEEFEREEQGKDVVGTIKIAFQSEQVSANEWSQRVRIIIEDDGAGIDPEIIKEIAIDKGIATTEALSVFNQQELLNLIFTNGFSTKEVVSSLSGRGVGLEAVKHEAQCLGGTAWVESELNKGTKFFIDVPVYQN